MESEVELKRGGRADLRMITSRTKKGNRTMELVGVKLKSNKQREPKRKEERVADRMDSRRGTREKMIATTLMKIVTFVALLKALSLNSRKKNERARLEARVRGLFVSSCEFEI